MEISDTQLISWIGNFFWPFMRVAMMMTVAPIFGSRLMPVRARIVSAIVITWLLLPIIPDVPTVNPLSPEGVLIVVQQLLIGMMMGFVLQMLFASLVVGGQTVALSMGLGFASMVDPQNGVQVPVVSQIYLVVATLLFLTLNGHLMLISMLADSFSSLPIASDGVSRQTLWDVVAWAGEMFAHGILIALPAVTALLLVNLAFGVITRSAPQLNIFGVGFPLTLAMGFVIILYTLPGMLPHFERVMESAFSMIQRVIYPLGR
ncbi:MAG: flagellar biosynthetic protein FliR [Gammaproteobacteria bacterium]|nr:flagellar biosynthetic protein FliR [Gammaproteobacteria bacterium]